jgi:hypothetical protein
MFDSKIHLERRQPKNHLRRISIEAEKQYEEESIARWLTLGDEALRNDRQHDDQSFWNRRSA